MDGVRAAINARLGADSSRRWGLTAWTLNEDAYVQSVQANHRPKWDDRPELKPHVLDLLAAAQRDVTLPQDEARLLARDAISGLTPELVELERDLLCLAYSAGVPVHPTPSMIRHLLARDTTQEHRRIQLRAALRSPRWAGTGGRWPQWEVLAKHREDTRGRPPEPMPPFDMEAFAAELREMEGR